MDRSLQYIIGKLEHANLVFGDKTNVKSVGAHSQQDPKQKGSYKCPFCSNDHKAVDCTKYKTIQARTDRVISQRLCFNPSVPVFIYSGMSENAQSFKRKRERERERR